MDRQAEPSLEYPLNRDANQTIFILTLLQSLQATSNRENCNYFTDLYSHDHDSLVDLGSPVLNGISEIS